MNKMPPPFWNPSVFFLYENFALIYLLLLFLLLLFFLILKTLICDIVKFCGDYGELFLLGRRKSLFFNKSYVTTQSVAWLGYEWRSHCALWLCFSELHLWREHRRRRKRDEDVDSKRQVYRPSDVWTHDQLSGILCRSWGNLC